MADGFEELRQFAKDCKRVAPGLEKDFYKELAAGGEVVAAKARSNASFSSRIPGSVKVRRRGVRVKVQAGGDGAPHAAAFENHGQTGSFRHPVFQTKERPDVWVSQPAHPFLTPAAEESMEAVELAVLRAVDITAARLVS